jgi:hypothetical protein
MFARKSNVFIFFTVMNVALFLLVLIHARLQRERMVPSLHYKAALVERLQLTDLCLFTDARYTRNPSMADWNTPFQDSPMTMEHFPSGTLALPPPHLYAR